MKIALIGYGKMGKAIKASAYASGIEVSVIMDSRYWKENLRGVTKAVMQPSNILMQPLNHINLAKTTFICFVLAL